MVLISAILGNKMAFARFLRTGEEVAVGVVAVGVGADLIKGQANKILGLKRK
jgi:hypothetical protein